MKKWVIVLESEGYSNLEITEIRKAREEDDSNPNVYITMTVEAADSRSAEYEARQELLRRLGVTQD